MAKKSLLKLINEEVIKTLRLIIFQFKSVTNFSQFKQV